jgi:hypothetical protein
LVSLRRIIMAFMNQEKKAKLAPGIKAVLKKYGVKGSLAVRNYSTLVMNIKSGPIDFIGNFNEVRMDRRTNPDDLAKDYLQINPYWYQEHFTGKAHKFLSELFREMNAGNHDRSDIMTDYFDVGWYVDVNIGNWNKPYEVM